MTFDWDRWEQANTCPSGKQMHKTAEKARDQLASMKAGMRKVTDTRHRRKFGEAFRGARLHERGGRKLRVYRCDKCDHFHVGHR